MPTAVTTVQPTRTNRREGNNAPIATVPFIRASAEHREPAGIDVTRAMTTSDQELGVFDIPAFGYVRSIVLLVEASGGVGTGLSAEEDAPWNVLKNIALTEPNGAVIAQFNTGYDLYLANKWGGYRNSVGADPKASPVYSPVASSGGGFAFMLRIPVEINLRDALGSLPNQNAAATFKLRATLGSVAQVIAGTVTTPPNVRVRAYLEAWDQPEAQTAGQTNQITPPAMNTTQFWSSQTFNVSAGNQTIRLTRLGNYVRNLIFVLRRGGTDRSTGHTDLPDPLTLFLDTRPLDIIERNNILNQMYERTGFGAKHGTITPGLDTPGGLDSGVFVYDFMHEFDGTLGKENRDLWLPTLGSTRLELQGNFGNAGTLTVLTNDVAIAGSVFI